MYKKCMYNVNILKMYVQNMYVQKMYVQKYMCFKREGIGISCKKNHV